MYIRTYHDGWHLFNDEMLFDVAGDPHEQNDLAAEKPDICARAGKLLGDWHKQMMDTQPDGYDTDPMETVLAEGGPFHARGCLQTYCEYLARTDRGWAIDELKRRHPGEFK